MCRVVAVAGSALCFFEARKILGGEVFEEGRWVGKEVEQRAVFCHGDDSL